MNDALWEAIGFAAFGLNILGNLMLAWKYRSGWAIRLLPNIGWAAYSLHFWNPALLANSVTFFAINCAGWWKWRRSQAQAHNEHEIALAEYRLGFLCGWKGTPVSEFRTPDYLRGYSDGMNITDN